MDEFSYWIAGHSAHVSHVDGFPGDGLKIDRSEGGAEVVLGAGNAPNYVPPHAWVHFAIPTPTTIADVRTTCDSTFLLYETKGDALIWIVEIWHANTQASSRAVLRRGQHLGQPTWVAENVFDGLAHPDYSIGISAHIKLEHEGREGGGSVFFAAAGARFRT